MIVGTAGHIDHGKTTLVKALTGVDTDRLPEEKRRGISIALGYAFMLVPGLDEPLGFIDVPGHERLVHTMLAGATGIDLALLLVAADDGPMEQTREHLAVLSLLGLSRGAVVVTKSDRVEGDRLAELQAEAQSLLQGTQLQGAPVFTVSAPTGKGVDGLRQWLFAQARSHTPRPSEGTAFRLAIDRAFTLDGLGTVATGTVHAGQVRVGELLRCVPGRDAAPLRVRSVRAQNREVTVARAGQRCAVALAGIAKGEIERGQWLVGEGAVSVSDRIDVQLTVWQGESRALRPGTPVHVHLGAAAAMGTLAVLDAGDSVAAGASARVQLVLRQPLGVWRGDRVILRDASATRTLAGGVVLDPFAPARYRRTPERMVELDAWARQDAPSRLQGLLAAAAQGVDLARWARAEGLAPRQRPELPPTVLVTSDGAWALESARAQLLEEAVLQALQDFHTRSPEELGPDSARLRRLTAPRLPDALWRLLLTGLLKAAHVVQRGAFVHLPEHGVCLSATEERIAQKVAPLLDAAGQRGGWVRELARDAGESEAMIRTTLARLAQRGDLHQVMKNLFYPVSAMARFAALAREIATREGEVKATSFRDATGLGRKRAIQILEYFDRIGMLRRVDASHRLRADTELFVSQ